jgi:hypothetical protein
MISFTLKTRTSYEENSFKIIFTLPLAMISKLKLFIKQSVTLKQIKYKF